MYNDNPFRNKKEKLWSDSFLKVFFFFRNGNNITTVAMPPTKKVELKVTIFKVRAPVEIHVQNISHILIMEENVSY